MARLIQSAETIDYTNAGSTTIDAGTIVPLTNFCGVAIRDIPVGETGALALTGIYESPCESSTIALGGKVYIKDGTVTGTATSADATVGCAVAAISSGTTVRFALNLK